MELCQRCEVTDYDRRTLWMSCLYDMEELGLPLDLSLLEDRHFYTLRVCKRCRADWMMAIKRWFETKPSKEDSDTGIYVRQFGANIQVTEEEFKK